MLIVAQQKTASTSLLDALKEITGLPGRQELKLKYVQLPDRTWSTRINRDWKPISASDMVDVDWPIIQRWTAWDVWHKQHLIPTPNNIDLLRRRKAPFIVLLRTPSEAVDAMRRLDGATKADFKWIPQLMKKFYDVWIENLSAWEDAMSIGFDELTTLPVQTVNRILAHFGREERVDEGFVLPRRRYTGGGEVGYRR